VQDTSTARTSVVRHVDHDLFARQMIGQRLAPRPLVGDLDVYGWAARFGASDITIEIFQAEGELIGIEALGTAAELRPLKLFDDRLKSLDLAVTMLDDGRHVAQKIVQQGMSDGRLSRSSRMPDSTFVRVDDQELSLPGA
jgi:hypothetical protein